MPSKMVESRTTKADHTGFLNFCNFFYNVIAAKFSPLITTAVYLIIQNMIISHLLNSFINTVIQLDIASYSSKLASSNYNAVFKRRPNKSLHGHFKPTCFKLYILHACYDSLNITFFISIFHSISIFLNQFLLMCRCFCANQRRYYSLTLVNASFTRLVI